MHNSYKQQVRTGYRFALVVYTVNAGAKPAEFMSASQ